MIKDIKYSFETEYQNGKHDIHVLLPENYAPENTCNVLYVLPVEKEFEHKYGKPLEILQQMNAANIYNLIIVQMGFEKTPWFGDHTSDLKTRQASYLKNFVVPFIEGKYSTPGKSAGRLLFGFSKSGWGAFSLILSFPDFFGFAAAWDSPMFPIKFNDYIQAVYGTQAQYALYCPELLISQHKKYFQKQNRLVLTGEKDWGNLNPAPHGGSHTVEAHILLQQAGILHHYDNSLNFPHCWNASWMLPTLDALIDLTRQK